MLGEEKLRLKMQFAYEVGKLFVKAGCSSTDLGAATEIPKATIKRCLKTVRERGSDILLLLPDVSEEELSRLQEKINEYIENGDRENVAFVQVQNLPEYKLCLLKKGITPNDDEIFEKVWNERVYEANNTVMVHIRRLRTKIKDDKREDKIITTVWGVGYKIDQ